MVYFHNPSRFDFEYWPPRLVKQPDDEPRRINPDDIVQLNESTLYIHDDNKRSQVRHLYNAGSYADIEDFWLANKLPGPIVLGNARKTEEGDYRIDRRYLNVSSELFKLVTLLLDGTNRFGFSPTTGENDEFLRDVFRGNKRDPHYADLAPPVHLDKRNILITREALKRCLDPEDPLAHSEERVVFGGRASVFSIAGKELIERVLENNTTYEDRLVPDTVPEDWL